MGKKVTVANLASEIEAILKEYGDEVSENMVEITKRVGQKGAQALKNASLSTFPASGKHKQRYGSAWTYKVEPARLYTKVIIHNRQPGLPHLLENGHASVNGGRVAGKVHIYPVEQKLIQEYEREVTNKL